MQRFHFDLTDGHTIISDDEGVEADDFTDVLTQAEAALREMRTDGELESLGRDWKLVIRTGADTVLITIPVM